MLHLRVEKVLTLALAAALTASGAKSSAAAVKIGGRVLRARTARPAAPVVRRGVGDCPRQTPNATGATLGTRADLPTNPRAGESGGTLSAEAAAVVSANNQFGADLYRHLQNSRDNLFFSPTSISMALSLAHAGAEGPTRRQIATVFHYELPDRSLHAGHVQLNSMLNAANERCRLNVANRLWVQDGFRFATPFLLTARQLCGAEPGIVDFGLPEQARAAINQWVAERTEGKVAEFLAPGDLVGASDQAKTRLVLANAIYFKGAWKYQFPKSNTTREPFHKSKDQSIATDMMKLAGELRYARTEDAQLVELPYVGDQLSMLILLPNELDGLPAVEEALSAENLQKWIARLAFKEEVHVAMPRFALDWQIDLKAALSSLGMPLAFSDQAEFPNISTEKGQQLYGAIHRATVDVNEEGTEAAAVSGGIGGDLPGPVPRPVYFTADHPYLFWILHHHSGAVLFLGRVADPG